MDIPEVSILPNITCALIYRAVAGSRFYDRGLLLQSAGNFPGKYRRIRIFNNVGRWEEEAIEAVLAKKPSRGYLSFEEASCDSAYLFPMGTPMRRIEII